jgi:hypothetical protein
MNKSAAEIRNLKQFDIDDERFDEEYPEWIGFGCPCRGAYELGSTIAAPSLNFRHCPAKDRNHGHLMHLGEGSALNQLPIYSQAFLRKILRLLPNLYETSFGAANFCTSEQVSVIEELLLPFAATLPHDMVEQERRYLSRDERTKFYREHQIIYYCL